jgi:hypothetical protein
MIFSVKKKGFLGIPGPPYCGIGATIRIRREMLCLSYAGFFLPIFLLTKILQLAPSEQVLNFRFFYFDLNVGKFWCYAI